MTSGEREPLRSSSEQAGAREVYVPTPTNFNEVVKTTVAIDNELMHPENLSPRSIYSLVITRNAGCFEEHRKSGYVSPHELKTGFELGLHAMMRSRHYNQEEHGQLLAGLFEGYLQQVRILQEISLQQRPPKPPLAHEQ